MDVFKQEVQKKIVVKFTVLLATMLFLAALSSVADLGVPKDSFQMQEAHANIITVDVQ